MGRTTETMVANDIGTDTKLVMVDFHMFVAIQMVVTSWSKNKVLRGTENRANNCRRAGKS